MTCSGLKSRLQQRLDPVSAWSPQRGAVRSDYDLNPDFSRPKVKLRPAAVLIPIIAREDGPSVLLTRRSDSLASHTGQIAFAGGRLDPGETALDAALREACEEIALDPAVVEPLGLGDPYETGTGFLVTPVVGWLTAPPAVTPSPAEVAEVFEAPWDFLMDPVNHRRDYYDQENGPRRWFWAMPYRERYIWGVTAGILKGLFNRLYGEETAPHQAAEADASERVG